MPTFQKKAFKFVILVVIVSFFTRCGFPEVKNEAPGINEVKKGSKFAIILPEDHRTGYIWQIKQDYDKKLLENSNVVWHGNEKGVHFNFKALQKGQTSLTFTNRKYTDTLNVKTFIVTILE